MCCGLTTWDNLIHHLEAPDTPPGTTWYTTWEQGGGRAGPFSVTHEIFNNFRNEKWSIYKHNFRTILFTQGFSFQKTFHRLKTIRSIFSRILLRKSKVLQNLLEWKWLERTQLARFSEEGSEDTKGRGLDDGWWKYCNTRKFFLAPAEG